MTSPTTALVGATIHPISAEPYVGTVLIRDGLLLDAGERLDAPVGASTINAWGMHLTPGLVDAHVHAGMHPPGEAASQNDVNEKSAPVMAGVRAIDAIDPFDQGFDMALAGGVTTVNVNPGSSNPFGGLTVAMHTHGRRVDDMVLRQPSGLKSALGENPIRVYGERKQTPSTRLGTALVMRQAFQAAQRRLDLRPDDIDLHLDALGLVLSREIPLRQHCHRADDIATALRLRAEFGYDLVLDHGTEAVVHAEAIREAGVPVLMGPMLGSKTKVELRGRDLRSPGRLVEAGVEVSLITDHPVNPIDQLILQAIMAVRSGMDRAAALRAITLNPARVLGLADEIGSIQPGKRADLVLWSGDPLDIYARPARVFQSGVEVATFDPADGIHTLLPR